MRNILAHIYEKLTNFNISEITLSLKPLMFRFINPFAKRPVTVTGVRIFNSVYRTRSRKLYYENRENARSLVTERVKHFLSYYEPKHGIRVGKIAIRNQKSRWGSCSKKGNLNFNYKLVFLEPSVRDYVIVHEICHIKEFNHGRGFWNLVAETVPDYREMRKKLRGMR